MSQKKQGGLLFGVLMGTLLGILFAPKKGKQLRDTFFKELQKGGIGVKTLSSNFKGLGREIIKAVQDTQTKPTKDQNRRARNLRSIKSGFKKEFAKLIQKVLSKRSK